MNKKRGIFLIIVFVIILAYLSSASHTLGSLDEKIEQEYAPGENISGWVNISFTNMPSDAVISTNFGDSIILSELLERLNVDYECGAAECGDNYRAINEDTSKVISMQAGDSRILSFYIQGEIDRIDSLSFRIESNATKSCSSQLKMDLLLDNNIDWENRKSSGEFLCYESYGCFVSSSSLTEYNLNAKPYCEKIFLNYAPSVQLGAWVKKGDGVYASGMIKMQLYSTSNQLLSECNLQSPLSSGGEISCSTNYSIGRAGDYYVCVRGQDAMSNYKIRGESDASCGFFDSYKGEYTNDYQIFGRGGKYDGIGTFSYNNSVFSQFSSGNLQSYLSSYILTKYNKDCSAGCSIPVKFSLGAGQQVIINNVNLQYTTLSGNLNSNKIYDAEASPSNINSGFILLDLEKAGFSAPSDYGEENLILYINGEEIISKEIEVIEKPIINGLSPIEAFAANPTKFSADASALGSKRITKYLWNFGDNNITEAGESVTHAYNSIGLFNLELIVYDSEGLSAKKTFSINVVSPREIINSTIIEKKNNFDNLSSQLSLMNSWEAERVKARINFTGMQSKLRNAETSYSSASSDVSYVNIMSNLVSLKIPKSIYKIKEDGTPFVLVFEGIDNDNLKSLGAGSYQNEDYESRIKNWFTENMGGNISSQSIIFDYGDGQEAILTFFKIDLKERENVGETYLVVEGNSVFKDSAVDLTNGKGLRINGDKEVVFSKEGLVSIWDLEAYLSPKFSQLVSMGNICNFDEVCDDNENSSCSDCEKSYLWIIWVIIILILIAAGWIVLKKGWIKIGGKKDGKDFQKYEENSFGVSELRSGFKPLNR